MEEEKTKSQSPSSLMFINPHPLLSLLLPPLTPPVFQFIFFKFQESKPKPQN